MLLQDKNNAIEKQGNRLALRKALGFENKQNEMLAQLTCRSGIRDEKNGSEVEGTNSRTLLTMLKC